MWCRDNCSVLWSVVLQGRDIRVTSIKGFGHLSLKIVEISWTLRLLYNFLKAHKSWLIECCISVKGISWLKNLSKIKYYGTFKRVMTNSMWNKYIEIWLLCLMALLYSCFVIWTLYELYLGSWKGMWVFVLGRTYTYIFINIYVCK